MKTISDQSIWSNTWKLLVVCAVLVNAGCQRSPWQWGSSAKHKVVRSSTSVSPPEDLQDVTRSAQAAMNRGDYTSAEDHYQRVIHAYENAEGENAPSVAAALNDLAGLYYEQESYAKAEPLVQRALGIYEKEFGEFDPNVAASLNNLANIYRNEGDFERAEPLYRRALAIQERSLSPRHPDVIRAKKNLAALLRAAGKLDEANRLVPDEGSGMSE